MPDNDQQITRLDPSQAIIQSPQVAGIRQLLQRSMPEIAKALPRHLTAERMIRVVMTAIQKTPDLLECTQQSLIAAVITASQLGLEPDGVLGRAYLIPRKNKKTGKKEAQFMPGYLGLIELAMRSDRVSYIAAELVFRCDEFKVIYGLERNLIHIPDLDNETRGEWDDDAKDLVGLRGAYAVVKYKDSSCDFEYMPLSRLKRIRRFSQSSSSEWSPWNTALGIDDMYRKCPIRKLAKRCPLSPEFQSAVHEEEMRESGMTIDGLRDDDDNADIKNEIATLLKEDIRSDKQGNRWNDARIRVEVEKRKTRKELEDYRDSLIEQVNSQPATVAPLAQQQQPIVEQDKPKESMQPIKEETTPAKQSNQAPSVEGCEDCAKAGGRCIKHMTVADKKSDKEIRKEQSKRREETIVKIGEYLSSIQQDAKPAAEQPHGSSLFGDFKKP